MSFIYWTEPGFCCGIQQLIHIWIRFILVSRIRIRINETDPDPGSKKSAKIMENFNKNQQKSLEYHTFFSKLLNSCLLTDIYSINNRTDHISEKYIFYRKKGWYFPDFRSDLEQDPDPIFHEADPRIRIHIKMKRIRNTEKEPKMW